MFYNNDEFRQEMPYGYGEGVDINITNTNTNTNTNVNQNINENDGMMYGMQQGPIVEAGRERVVQRNIVHEVKQLSPLMQYQTKEINKYKYKKRPGIKIPNLYAIFLKLFFLHF